MAVGPGLFTSGDLFRVIVPGGGAHVWLPPVGGSFSARELLVTLDEDLVLSGSLAYRFHPRCLARLDLSWAQADATAEARVGQTVELHQWERLSFILSGLSMECQLLHARAYPYAVAGVTASRLSAVDATALDQTRLGLRAGVGFHVALDSRWGIRSELRDTWQQFDMAPYRQDSTFSGQSFAELGPQHLVELLLQVRGLF